MADDEKELRAEFEVWADRNGIDLTWMNMSAIAWEEFKAQKRAEAACMQDNYTHLNTSPKAPK
jgi:hypothetical protein